MRTFGTVAALAKIIVPLGLAWAAPLGCEGSQTMATSGAGGDSASSSASASSGGGSGQGGAGQGGGEGGVAEGPPVRFVGRFDTSDPPGTRFGWPGSAIVTRFSGTSIAVSMKDESSPGSSNFFQVVIDGQASSVIEVNNQAEVYPIAMGLPAGEHDLVLHRRTEGWVGTTQFLGFQVDPGEGPLPTWAPPDRRIEVIGDSISAGYGVDGPNESCPFTTATENNYLTYGPVAARALSAEATIIAVSGIGAYRNGDGSVTGTMPEVYERAILTDPSSTWDFSKWVPQAVVINLGTNDFAQGDPGAKPFIGAYKDLVAKVRGHYPDAYIFCAVGPMLSDFYPPGEEALTKARSYVSKVVDDLTALGDARMRFIEFPTQDLADGLGCDYHPGVKTNQIMADILVAALKTELGWQ